MRFVSTVGDGQRRKSHLTRGGKSTKGGERARKVNSPLPFGIIIRQPLKYPVYDDRRGNFAFEASRAGHQKPPFKLSALRLLNFQNFPSLLSERLLIRGYILMRPAIIRFEWWILRGTFTHELIFLIGNDSRLFSPFFLNLKDNTKSVADWSDICIRGGFPLENVKSGLWAS